MWSRGGVQAMMQRGQMWDYDADDDQVSVFSEESRGCGFTCVITPSSMAAELAPDLTHQEAADLYLGVSAIVGM